MRHLGFDDGTLPASQNDLLVPRWDSVRECASENADHAPHSLLCLVIIQQFSGYRVFVEIGRPAIECQTSWHWSHESFLRWKNDRRVVSFMRRPGARHHLPIHLLRRASSKLGSDCMINCSRAMMRFPKSTSETASPYPCKPNDESQTAPRALPSLRAPKLSGLGAIAQPSLFTLKIVELPEILQLRRCYLPSRASSRRPEVRRRGRSLSSCSTCRRSPSERILHVR